MNPIKRMLSLAGVLMALLAISVVPSAGASADVPFRGMDTLVVTLLGSPEGPQPVQYTASGGGHATHSGRFTVENDEGTINFATGEFLGSYTLIAANGDTLSGTATGFLTGPDTVHTSGPIVGGTGRFAGATGELTFDGVVVEQTTTGAIVNNTITGTISSVGLS